MKRLHIVGKSKDNKRLFLAQKSGAKFGSFEVPVGRKLLRLMEEIQDARSDRQKPAPPANQGDVTGVRVLTPAPAQPAATAAAGTAGRAGPGARPAARQLRIAGDEIDIPIDTTEGGTRSDGAAPAEAVDAAVPPLFATDPAVAATQAADAAAEQAAAVRPPRLDPVPRRSRPEIPARSKLSPAEIQALIRAGRGVRSVANMAGTPVAWVKYLAEPIQQERLGIVRQMLLVRQERARLGPSSAPIGQSILENLRGRGVRNPEAIFDQGFSAHRPDGREWRVRLTFDHRGNRYVANWSFDPQTREVVPLNTMATQLGWRREPGRDDEEPKPRRTRAKSRSTAKRRTSSRKKSTTRKTSTRRTAAARKSTRKTTSRSRRR